MDKRQQIIYKALEEAGILKEIEEVVKIKNGDIGEDMIKTAIALELQRLYEENKKLKLGIITSKEHRQPREMDKAIKRIEELDLMVKYLQRIYKRDVCCNKDYLREICPNCSKEDILKDISDEIERLKGDNSDNSQENLSKDNPAPLDTLRGSKIGDVQQTKEKREDE